MAIRIGLTGYHGHVGHELLKQHPETYFPLVCDVTRPQEVEMEIRGKKPSLILHLASVSNVDICESPENKQWVMDVNVRGTANVAEAAMEHNIGMVLLSTSQIFSGKSFWNTYSEGDTPKPVNWYGWTKWGAERLQHIYPFMKIVRTSYLFDYARLSEQIDILRKGNYAQYPNFIKRSFMYLPHFAESLNEYLSKFDKMPKKLHIAGTETISWYDFMNCVAHNYLINEEQITERTTELPDKAPRPHKAGLNVNLSKRLYLPQYSYADGVREMAGL